MAQSDALRDLRNLTQELEQLTALYRKTYNFAARRELVEQMTKLLLALQIIKGV